MGHPLRLGLQSGIHDRFDLGAVISRFAPATRRNRSASRSQKIAPQVKTGTSRTLGGLTRATNDVGIALLPDARHLAVAVFVADSKADEAIRDAVIARIARAAWDRWSGQAAPHR